MTGELLIRLARESLFLALALAAPVVLAALVVAMAVGVLQAATQVQDATVGFAPRAAAVAVALVVVAPRSTWEPTKLRWISTVPAPMHSPRTSR